MTSYNKFNNQHQSPSFLPVDKTTNNLLFTNHAMANEVFLKSLNKSYLGRMSNQKQITKLIPIQQEQNFQREIQQTPKKRVRIDFSKFKGEAMSQIRQTQLNEQDLKYLYIKSFQNNQGYQLYNPSSCYFLCNSTHQNPGKLLVETINQSTIEFYLSIGKSQFSKLFLSLNFDTISAQLQFKNIPQNRQLMILFGKNTLLLYHKKYQVLQHWYNLIEKMINQSKGKQYNLTKIMRNQQFFNYRYQTEDFFTKNCQTGDIILFQDDHLFAKIQRFVTRSDFDHVAMVIKSIQHGLLLFQSNGGIGVSLTPWRYVIRYGWYNNIPKISWRRLKTQRNQQFNQIITNFVTQNLKKEYHISLGKLTAHQSVVRSAGIVKQEDDTGFFCSELIATLYKELGLLTRDKTSQSYQPACKFYPKDFSEKSGRNLDKGVLSNEYEIYFDNVLLKETYRGLIKQQKNEI